MDRSLPSGGLLLGLAIGFVAGYAAAAARRAWSDFTKTKASLPGLKKTAWGATKPAGGWIVVVVVLAVAAVAWAVDRS